ncbi:Nonribosomal peptide synthetase [Lachnellula subtilissima]|uniref:Nonribosomal peptide synthetase n=1 Tax=Lachnellula subtilissima TaxID=602034 RepID=A0A8H8S116_9HELO|nr:Nonribosomal peptide synthetase [Lachnellula subtilissima]
MAMDSLGFSEEMCIQHLWQLLQLAACKYGENGILAYPSNMLGKPDFMSYPDLLVKAQQNSLLLRRIQGLRSVSIVLIHFKNHLDNIEWFWSVLAAGYIPAMSTAFTNLADGRVKHILHLHKLLENPICLTRQEHLKDFAGQNELRIKTIESLHTTEHLDYHCSPENSRQSSKSPEDLAVLMLTSGSTGNCKAVCLSHQQILNSIAGKSSYLGTRKGDTFLNWIALDHVAALVELHLHSMFLGTNQVHLHALAVLQSPLTFLRLINEHRVTFSFAPNFFLAKLRRTLEVLIQDDSAAPGRENWDFSCLRRLTSGGEANVVETCRGLTDLLSAWGLGSRVITPGFGMTETCAGSICNKQCPEADLYARRDFAAVGFCIPGIHMRLTPLSQEGPVLGEGHRGNLEICGSIVFSEYYNDMASTAEAFTHDGWFKTGDQAYLDTDGQLVLCGRGKETMIINGLKYSPHEVEAALEDASVPGLTAGYTAVFSYHPKGSQTEQICAVYLPNYHREDTQARVDTNDQVCKVTLLQTGVRPNVIPLHGVVLQRSTLGKLSRAKIRSSFERGDYLYYQQVNDRIMQSHKAASYVEPSTPMETMILQNCERLFELDRYELGTTTPIFDLGVTSIDIIRLKQRLEKSMSIEDIPIITIMMNPTIKTLAVALEKSNQSHAYDPVVVLRDGGEKAPLWLIHPGVGEILVFLGLSKYLTDRPVYALRARGFDGEDFFVDIPDAVQVYHKAIKLKQPKGPYAIAGYSYGAMLAFEVAKAIRSKDNDEIAFLGSFNLPPHIKSRMHQLDWVECLLNLAYFMDLISDSYAQAISPELHQMGEREQVLNYVLEVADSTRMGELGLNREKLGKWADLAMNLQSMAKEYEPSGRVENMDVFYATPLIALAKSKTEWLSEDLSKWTDFSATTRFHEVDGEHYTMIGPLHVNSFQRILKAALREAGC